MDAVTLDRLDQRAADILESARAAHDPVKCYALFSGGHDSLVATHAASRHLSLDAVVHINTGIGIPDTRTYVRETCQDHGWPLIEKTPPQKTYEDLVMEYGFPGPAAHHLPYRYLKERALRVVVREAKEHRHDRVLLVSGARRAESQRRMAHSKAVERIGAQVWASPIVEWGAGDVQDYIDRHDLERNEVVDLLHMSGECLCGAFATRGELREIETWYPEVADRIRDLEAQAEAAGVDRCRWGQRREETAQEVPLTEYGMMCTDCPARHASEDHDHD